MHAIVNPLIARTIFCYSSLAHARDSGLVYPPINFLFTANELFVYCRYPVSDAAVVASLRSLIVRLCVNALDMPLVKLR